MNSFFPNWCAGAWSQFRDLAANDNFGEFEFARMRREMTSWAQERMNRPEWQQMAWQAMCQAQTMRRPS